MTNTEKLVPEQFQNALHRVFMSSAPHKGDRDGIMLANREEAGQRLAEQLVQDGVTADIVLAIPRGGLPVGHSIAAALESPLDVITASKIAAPFNPELAVGAVSSTGSVWLNESLIEELEIDDVYIEDGVRVEQENAKDATKQYRGTADLPDLGGKTVLIADDGAATGATVRACARQAYEMGAERVILAIPVLPEETADELAAVVDQLVYLTAPARFGAVSQFYEEFKQLSSTEAATYLED